jgi:O-antigen/teichoic acid export membrane protein
VATGLLAYVVFALTTRGLSAADAAPVSVLWSYWAVAGAALTFPLQHWITRSVPAHGEAAVRRAAARLVTTVVLLGAGATSVAWLVREPLFGRSDMWFPAMVGMVTIGSALTGVTRGVLSARHRFTAVAASMVAENAVRCLAAGVLLTAEVRSAVGYGICLVVGHLVVVLWPSAFRLSPSGETDPVSPFAFLAGAGFGQVSAQVVLTSGPVLLALADGSPAQVTALFAALALFRAPYMVALGMMPQLMSRVTAAVLAGEVRALRRLAAWGAAATVVAVPAAALLAARIGPELLELVFGAGVRLDAAPAALVAAGCTVAIANLVLMVGAMAQGRPLAVARAWVAALGGGVAAFVLLGGLAPLDRVVWTFVAAETVALAGLVVVVNGTVRRTPEHQSPA